MSRVAGLRRAGGAIAEAGHLGLAWISGRSRGARAHGSAWSFVARRGRGRVMTKGRNRGASHLDGFVIACEEGIVLCCRKMAARLK